VGSIAQQVFGLLQKGLSVMQAQTNMAQECMGGDIPKFQNDRHSLGRPLRQAPLDFFPPNVRSYFISQLVLFLPKAAERINEDDFGVLHLEVGALKLETRAAILRHDWDLVCAHYSFVARILESASAELRDALHVSYLGMLFYGETSIGFVKARSLLPKPLAMTLENIERHYEDLVH
jgi:hypothetical protein